MLRELILSTGYWAFLLTLAAFQLGQYLRKKTGLAVCNPILVAIIIVIPFLLLTGISNDNYQAGMKQMSWLLTPCTVCLGIPLHTQLNRLKGKMSAILIGILAGVAANLIFIAGLCAVLGLDQTIMISLLPKSTTTAMAIPLSESANGLVPLTTIAVIITGIFGSVIGPALCKVFRIHNDIAQGVAYGTTSHVAGAAKAAEQSELSGAVGSLAMVAAGIMTAAIIPVMLRMVI